MTSAENIKMKHTLNVHINIKCKCKCKMGPYWFEGMLGGGGGGGGLSGYVRFEWLRTVHICRFVNSLHCHKKYLLLEVSWAYKRFGVVLRFGPFSFCLPRLTYFIVSCLSSTIFRAASVSCPTLAMSTR